MPASSLIDLVAEAVIHLCNLSRDDPYLDRPKLVKLLYYADAAACRQNDQSITGATYRHFPDGSLPDEFRSAPDWNSAATP